MSLMQVNSGNNIPNEINVIIEIPMNAAPVKYEVDKHTGTLFVDRFLATAMFYPANYGYIPHTLSEDGDPVDVVVITPYPLISAAVIACRPIGILKMTDESGIDAKILAVPIRKLSQLYDKISTYNDLPQPLLLAFEHFFKHYKDLEPGKWAQINGWEGPEIAHKEIVSGIQKFKNNI